MYIRALSTYPLFYCLLYQQINKHFLIFFCVVDLLHESSDVPLASSSGTILIPTPQDEVLASTSIQKPTSCIDKITQPKAPVWFQQFEGLKNKQLDAINKNATQLNDR